MKTKEKLLRLLEENKGDYISGQEIAESLSLTRTSIWKAINALKKEGYEIESSTNKGYCLLETSDVVSLDAISKHLKYDIVTPVVFTSIESTNTYLINEAAKGAPEGLLCVSSEQTGGKGRRGRSFYSPEGTGVYFSILLRPHMYNTNNAGSITTMAAVAVCEAIEEISDKSPSIKWVNDVFLDSKKICGILTEASFDLEGGFLDYAVLGIGINVYSPIGGFPDEIKDIAGAIFENRNSNTKSILCAAVINKFLSYYLSQNTDSFKDSYRNRCFVLGKKIDVILPNKTTPATAIDLDDDLHLIVEYEDGTRETLSSGEVSIRI